MYGLIFLIPMLLYLIIGCVFAGLFHDKSVFYILSWPAAVFMIVAFYRNKRKSDVMSKVIAVGKLVNGKVIFTKTLKRTDIYEKLQSTGND